MWLRRGLGLLIVLASAALVVLAARPRSPVEPPVLDEALMAPDVEVLAAADAPRTIDELRAQIATVLEREGVPGAGIALVGKNGPIWVGGVGVRDLETRQPVDGDTMFRVGSLSKMIVTLGVMRLVDQGKLSLDRPLRELVPDAGITNPWEDTSAVTLAHVMEHTAGFDDMRFNEMFSSDDALPVTDALALNPRSRIARWRPGTRMAYSNVGFTVAGRAIEVATGEPFDVWLRREVLQPLGMRDADFRRTPDISPRLATGYIRPGTPTPYRSIAHRPSGGLIVSTRDLGKLVEFWLRRGEGFPAIVSAAGLDRIEHTGTLPYPATDANYGFANYGDVNHPVYSRGHDGAVPGFLSTVRYFPELGVGYAFMVDSTGSDRVVPKLRGLLFAYLAGRQRIPDAVATPARPDVPGAGYFAYGSPRHQLFAFLDVALTGWRVAALPGGVRIDPLRGEGRELVATRDGGYRMPGQSGSALRFTRTSDGTPVMITPYMYAEGASWWWARARLIALCIAWYLLELAPVWLACVAALLLARGRRNAEIGVALWPALAATTLFMMPHLLFAAAETSVLGEVAPWTVGFFVASIVFAVASAAGILSALRAWLRPDRRWVWLVVPTACSLAASAMTVWLGANGIIGLRTWAW